MSVRSRCLASLLALLGATGCATSAPELPAAYAPAPEPAKEPAFDATAESELLKVDFAAGRWEEVLDRAARCSRAAEDWELRWGAAAMATIAASRLRRWEECVRYSRVCGEEEPRLPSREGMENAIRGVILLGAEALIALDRFADAEFELEVVASRLPDLRESPGWNSLRDLARKPAAIEFAPPDPALLRDGEKFVEGWSRLKRATPAAIDHIRQRLGVPDLPFPPVRVRVVDGSLENEYWLMSANVIPRGSEWIGVIRVRLEAVLHPTLQDERLLAHELTHVLHFAGTKPKESPHWLSEGIAHWVESADDLIHRDMVLGRAMRAYGSPETTVSALLQSEAAMTSADHDAQRVCGAVVFFQLERMLGRAAVQRLVLRLLKEEDWAAVINEETRLDMPGLLERVRSSYMEWTAATFPERDEVLVASRLAAEGQLRESAQSVNSYIEGAADGPTRWVAEVLRLDVLVKLEDWPAARAALAPIHALRRSRPLAGPVGQGVMSEVGFLRVSRDWAGLAALAREARESLWVLDREWRAELDQALAEAEKHLAEAAPPK